MNNQYYYNSSGNSSNTNYYDNQNSNYSNNSFYNDKVFIFFYYLI